MSLAAALLALVAAYLLLVGTYLAIVDVEPQAPRRAWAILKAAAWLSFLVLVAIAWGEWFPWLQTLYQPIVPR